MPSLSLPRAALRPALGLALLALLALAGGACSRRHAGAKPAASPLFTGHEAKRRVWLYFPSSKRAGFVAVAADIYETSSVVAQAKQVLLDLMAGPPQGEEGAVACFAPGASYLEVYLDGDQAVVDLPSATVAALPGGTSSEVAVLYCLVRTLCADVPGVARVRFLVDGQAAESLRGHFDLQDPLSPSDF